MAPRTGRRRAAPPIVAAVVQPVTRRLARIEGLLLEMRHEQEAKLRRLGRIQQQLDDLAQTVAASRRTIARLSKLICRVSLRKVKLTAGSRKPEAATLIPGDDRDRGRS